MKRLFRIKADDSWRGEHEYRSYWDLYALILGVCQDRARTVTAIARYTHQNFVGVKKHIETLQGKGWIEIDTSTHSDKGVCYLTTPSGKEYLKLYLGLWNFAFKSSK